MRYTSATDKGLVRGNNEDFHAAMSVGDDSVFVIADGMGGHAVGELASRTAVQYVMSSLSRELEAAKTKQDLEDVLHLLIEKTNVILSLEK